MSIRVTNALGEFEYNAIPSEVGDPVEANPETTGDEEDLTSIKIDDTTYKVGEGSDARTYGTFPDTWRTSGTIAQFCSDVNADSTAIEGKAYLGELTCSDLPFNGNADTKVEVLSGQGTSGKAIHIVITSGDVSPYRWEYTYWNNGSDVSGWIEFSKVDANPETIGTETQLGSIEIDGVKYLVLSLSDANTRYLSKQGGVAPEVFDLDVYNTVSQLTTRMLSLGITNIQRFVILGHNSVDLMQLKTKNDIDIKHVTPGGTYNMLDSANTSANPGLDGTESNLTSIKINKTNYKIPDGSIVVNTNASNVLSNDDYTLLASNYNIKPCFVLDNANRLFRVTQIVQNNLYCDLMGTGMSTYGLNVVSAYIDSSTKKLTAYGTSLKKVEANPTLSGNEYELNGIQIGSNKYKVPTGVSQSDFDWLVNSVQTLAAQSGHSLALALNASNKVEQLSAEDSSENSVPIIYEDVTT